MCYYVYVLKSITTGELYKGFTSNIDRRLCQHINKETNFGKLKSPLKLIHVEVVNSGEEARVLEKYFKSGFGREILAEVAELADA